MDEQQLDSLIRNLGGELYLVGGTVRDSLMGRESMDRDYVVVGLDSLPFTRVVGKDFPVYLISLDATGSMPITAQIALARTYSGNRTVAHPAGILNDPGTSIEDDLSRRDLTMNAMAVRIATGQLIDPFGGKRDLEEGILRHTSERFAEDPLRVYRVARFAARYGFNIHPDTRALMSRLKPELAGVSSERVYMELVKALESPYPDRFFRELDGLLDVHFPEIEALKVPDKHDGTAFEHTMSVLGRGVGLKERFALLCHDLGKGVSPSPPFHGKHHQQTQLVESLCRRLKAPTDLEALAKKVMFNHMRVKVLHEMRPGKLINLVRDDIFIILRLSYLESAGRYKREDYVAHVKLAKKILNLKKTITGDMLIQRGVTPDKTFGDKLLQLRVKAFRGLDRP